MDRDHLPREIAAAGINATFFEEQGNCPGAVKGIVDEDGHTCMEPLSLVLPSFFPDAGATTLCDVCCLTCANAGQTCPGTLAASTTRRLQKRVSGKTDRSEPACSSLCSHAGYDLESEECRELCSQAGSLIGFIDRSIGESTDGFFGGSTGGSGGGSPSPAPSGGRRRVSVDVGGLDPGCIHACIMSYNDPFSPDGRSAPPYAARRRRDPVPTALTHPPFSVVSGGEFKVCFCDSARADCTAPSAYDVEVGSLRSSGISCLLEQGLSNTNECVSQTEGGLRCS